MWASCLADPSDFWFWLLVLGVAIVGGGWFAFRWLHIARMLEDTPTSRIRSAAQGYVELAGRCGALSGTTNLAPLTQRPCVWWQYRVQRRTGSTSRGNQRTKWQTVNSGRSEKDPDFERRHPGRATIEIVAPAPYEIFEPWADKTWGKRGDDYEALKQSYGERLLEHLYDKVPQIRGRVDYWEVSTPLSMQWFCGWERGELYGLDHDPARLQQRWLRPRTKVPGLWLTGQDVMSCGVSGAMMGGVAAATAVAGMRRMVGEEDAVTDALFRFTRPLTGAYFWCPPLAVDGRLDLRALGL